MWVWLNSFAHGTRQDIAAVGDGRRGWPLSYLAAVVLEAAEDDRTLRALQSSALIPLELQMLGSGHEAHPEAHEFVTRMARAIRSYRESTQR